MIRALYPGTFDPVTNGHLDIVRRSQELFDELIIGIAINSSKTPMFTLEERINMIKITLKDVENIEHNKIKIDYIDTLLVNYAKQNNINVIIRGLRAVSDFEYELQMALMNRKLDNSLETIFMTPREENIYLSSSFVREIAYYGGDISKLVPNGITEIIINKAQQIRRQRNEID